MSHLSNESSLWRSVPLHVERKVIRAGERAMAKMTFERLRTSVLPRVSETGNISILAIDCRKTMIQMTFWSSSIPQDDSSDLVSSSLLENDHGHPGQVHAYGFSPV